LEQSGKSLLAAHTLLNTQKKGGLAVYIDTENALSTEFLNAIGLNLKEMLYIPLETVEDIFETVETIVEKVRSSDKNRLVTIVVDSIAGASTKTEMAADFDKDGYATAKALIISKAMRKITNLIGRERICLIFTNQLRQKLNAPAFSDPWTTPGGRMELCLQ
jgi:recombination protein RecA